ncbi:DEAD/DEAH box helicase [Antarcticibacterium sp. 1MA-6-2]|nr:DEAD/DEAH box helicase [Antarcticibacterium sp. 1MA-6-2]UJH90771.1 DEAD/DEAH box helicase [Antarcticibacterium sp. 1MA-6-2]
MEKCQKIIRLLKTHFGFENFRLNQEEIIKEILSSKDTLAIMPTGGGKSICFQLPALILEGTTVVISPLIALMKDQVDSLLANGIAAAF